MGKIIPKFHLILVAFIIFTFVPFSFSATKQDTKRVQELRDKGYEAQCMGNLDMALNYYQKAIEIDPYYAVAYNDIGVVFEAKGMNEQAKNAYLKALSVDPNFLSAYYNLAALYQKEGEINQAAYYWRMRINLGDWSDVWTWRAKEHLDDLGTEAEIDAGRLPITGDLGLGFKPDPKDDAQYHLNRGRRFLGAGKYVAALKELNAAIVLDPQNKEIKDLLEDAQRKALLYN